MLKNFNHKIEKRTMFIGYDHNLKQKGFGKNKKMGNRTLQVVE